MKILEDLERHLMCGDSFTEYDQTIDGVLTAFITGFGYKAERALPALIRVARAAEAFRISEPGENRVFTEQHELWVALQQLRDLSAEDEE